MKRNTTSRLPDIIVNTIDDNYTVVPNSVIRHPELSWKAKGLFSLMLSNKDGWTSYIETIQQQGKDGRDSIMAGLRELEEQGFLLRIKYRDNEKKRWVGSVWVCIAYPFQFNESALSEIQEKHGIELDLKAIPTNGKPTNGKPTNGFSTYGFSATNNINNNNTNYKEILSKDNIQDSENPVCYNTIDEIIDFWNELEETPTHKNKDTKVYQTISSHINNLLQGFPIICKKDSTPTERMTQFNESFNIPPKIIHKKWTPAEIKQHLKTIVNSAAYDGRGLNSVFWNNFNGKRAKGFSLFLSEYKKEKTPKKYNILVGKFCKLLKIPLPAVGKHKSWAIMLQELHEQHSTKKIMSVMQWQAANSEGKYAFVVEGMEEFVDKFDRIHKRMLAEKSGKKKGFVGSDLENRKHEYEQNDEVI
jgi:hypothetical protein